MPLENAQYIAELVETNPDGTDLASTLDNHDRVIKTAVKGSFPNFTGTQVSPSFVNKTEAEINDSGELSKDEDITGDWTKNGIPIAVNRPKERLVTGDDTVLQSDEQSIIRYTGAGNTLTFDALLVDTVGTIKNVGTGALVLAEGTAAITHLDGLGSSPTGNRSLGPGSVMEYSYTETNQVEIWGNGLS